MSIFQRAIHTIPVLGLAITLGCGSSSVAHLESEDLSSLNSESTSDAEELNEEQIQSTSTTENLEQTAHKKRFLLAEFEPPYPNRVNPFAPPSRAIRQTQRNDTSESSVILLGFAKLDEPKAILDIDGVVSPLANGDQYAGVQVISIEPPNAVIQRGRDRWTASIE